MAQWKQVWDGRTGRQCTLMPVKSSIRLAIKKSLHEAAELLDGCTQCNLREDAYSHRERDHTRIKM